MKPVEASPRGWGLSSRIVALSLGLLLLVQVAVFGVLRNSIEKSARSQISHELEIGERVWLRLLDQNAQKLRQGATLLAADFGFRAAVNSGDIDTIKSALENNGARIGATVTALIDTNLELRAVSDSPDLVSLTATLKLMAPGLSRNPKGSQIALVWGVPFQFVIVPMKAPLVIGWVLMGFPINQGLADDMRALSDMHVAIVNRAVGQKGSVVVSTLSGEALKNLKANPGDVNELYVDGAMFVARSIQMEAGTEVGAGTVTTLLFRSFDEVVAPFRQTQVALAWVTALGVILFGVGSVFTARRVTTPLRSLVSASRRLGRGEYDVPMEHTQRTDEIGRLANAFDHMRLGIAAQQLEIRKLAYWDRLTGLPNRAQFREAVQLAIDRHGKPGDVAQSGMAVIMLDLDRFKHVNDVLGYANGDRLLDAVAKRLAALDIKSSDMVARLGGDEFAVLLTHCDAVEAIAVAQRIVTSFEEPLAFEDQMVDLSAGIGIACWPVHAMDVDTLLSHAEVAMYAAKAKTTVVQMYDPAQDSGSKQTLSLLTELRHAVEHGELRLYLQPKIDLRHSEVTAAEALVRWQHPQRGLIPPMEFIPFAEQTGFVRQMTLWMFDEAARLWRDLQTHTQPLRIAINLSTRDLLDLDFPQRLDAMLLKHNVPASAFCLEITESAIMDDPQRAESTLNRLHERGFKLSIDDFGTGYSSLAYLKRLPVDELKIDKSFVMAMEKDEDDAKIVRSTIDLAHNLGLSVVAEGVENAIIYNRLKELRCDEAQGYFMSKPLPAAEFGAWRERWQQKLIVNRAESGQSIPMPLM